MARIRAFSILSTCAAFVAAPGFAGGFTAPMVEPTPVVAVSPAASESFSWHGAYAGAGIGYAFGGDDKVS